MKKTHVWSGEKLTFKTNLALSFKIKFFFFTNNFISSSKPNMLKSYNDFLQVFELKCKKVKLTKRTGVNFIKVGRKAQIIEIAKSIYALRLHPTFEKLFTGVKDRPKVW